MWRRKPGIARDDDAPGLDGVLVGHVDPVQSIPRPFHHRCEWFFAATVWGATAYCRSNARAVKHCRPAPSSSERVPRVPRDYAGCGVERTLHVRRTGDDGIPVIHAGAGRTALSAPSGTAADTIPS